mgnify:FL=1
MREKQKLYFIVGPTASGKTAASIEVAKRIDAEVISADSIQVYRGMDIGSAKPSMEERTGIPHHMLSVVAPDEPKFSVARFREMADACIVDIAAREKRPLVVGGTGLYVNALTYPLSFTGAPADPMIREKYVSLEAELPGAAHKRLQEVDPASAARLHPNDKKRVIRALEVFELTGRPISENGEGFSALDASKLPYTVRIAGLTMPREVLYARIEQRVDRMMEQGLLDEVKALLEKGYSPELPALQGLGYKQLLSFLSGTITLSEAVEAIKRETRRFAKRQITWFKRDSRIRWYDAAAYADTSALGAAIAAQFLQEDGEE